MTTDWMNQIFCGDACRLLTRLPAQSVDLIFTSPPYANQRRKQYPSTPPDQYVDWFIPIAAELQRVLKPTGTFILNIKENVVQGERSSYVLKLILALREQGWLWTEEFIWHKKNSVPGKWPNRLRDGWERLLQFNRQKKFCMYQEAVMIPIHPSTVGRLKRLKAADKILMPMKTGSPFTRNLSHWLNKDKVYPCNVLHLATESHNRQHCAAFPESLPTWFIQLFTQKNDIILDPFMGSGTTAVSALKLGRRFVGMDISADYCRVAQHRIQSLSANSAQIIDA
jgi:site-specific DNA-methyltransferase (adenine-specific)